MLNGLNLISKSLINLDDARYQIALFIDHYNNKRLHSFLFYLTPDNFLNDRITEKLEQRNIKLLESKNIVMSLEMFSYFLPYLSIAFLHFALNHYSIVLG